MCEMGPSGEFVQFVGKLAEAVVPLAVSVHFFTAHVSERGLAARQSGLLVNKATHLGAYLSYPIMVHSGMMKLLTAEDWSIGNTYERRRRKARWNRSRPAEQCEDRCVAHEGLGLGFTSWGSPFGPFRQSQQDRMVVVSRLRARAVRTSVP